jgi:hypothetical protein
MLAKPEVQPNQRRDDLMSQPSMQAITLGVEKTRPEEAMTEMRRGAAV